MTPTAPAGKAIDPATRKLIWVIVIGALAPALDTTIVNVALASMGRSLHVSVATSQWTLTGYLLAMGMAMPLAQWVSERFGSKRVWLCCLAVFLVGSVLAGAAWDMASLIVFRLVQGAAARGHVAVADHDADPRSGPRPAGPRGGDCDDDRRGGADLRTRRRRRDRHQPRLAVGLLRQPADLPGGHVARLAHAPAGRSWRACRSTGRCC